MADQASSRVTTNLKRSNLVYINSLIDAEAEKGGEFIIVSPAYITEQMINTLINNKGYNVTTKQDSMGSYKEYKISW
mgnify:CR=1 FL=1|tara:strand:- start:2736 stop:2966 length:231 start_codon:yes stop_codon:yes gene_type:complete